MESHLIKEIASMCGSKQLSQQNPGIEMRLYEWKHLQLGLKGTEIGQSGGSLLNFWNSIGHNNRDIQL